MSVGQKWVNMRKEIVCSSCGARVEEKLAKCPYCDTMIVEGARQAYMDRLYDLREEMDELKTIPIETVKSEARRQGKRVRRILFITGVVVLVLAGLLFWESRRYERDNKADFIWGQQNFPVMSALYEKGEMEQLKDLFYQALEEDRAVWNWEYYDQFTEWLEEMENSNEM